MKKQKILNKKRLLMALKRHNRAGCSDKKLLWRANLYVDDQATDWNKRHPWQFGNEWNYYHRGITETNTPSYALATNGSGNIGTERLEGYLTPGNGQQVVSILPSTWHGNDDDRTTNWNQNYSVVYSWGSTTSPFEYNTEMLQQREAIRTYYQGLIDVSTEEENPNFWNSLANYRTTTAPPWNCDNDNPGENEEECVWENYRTEAERPGANNYPNLYNWTAAAVYNADQPGYSNYPFQDNNSIGIDCGGLIYMSALYAGEKYVLDGERVWLDAAGIDDWADWTGDFNDDVDDNNNLNLIAKRGSLENLSLIVPGDIGYFFTDDGLYHVWIVVDIEYNDNGTLTDENGAIDLSKIKVIEATYWRDYAQNIKGGRVINTNGLDYFQTNGYFWVIGRIKQ